MAHIYIDCVHRSCLFSLPQTISNSDSLLSFEDMEPSREQHKLNVVIDPRFLFFFSEKPIRRGKSCLDLPRLEIYFN